MNSWLKKCVAGLAIVATLGTAALAVDSDLDGVDDALDVCCATPPGVPVDEHGRPLGDLDLDCDVDLEDAAIFWSAYTGPLPFQAPCASGDDTENQCLMGTHNCDPNADCTDTSNGFYCTCHEGFSGSGVHCSDINECAQNICGPGGICTNFPGTYSCVCGPGYTNVNGLCSDINECLDEGLCGDAGECANLPGTYTCHCNPGFADCDGKPDCEVSLGAYSNTCGTATYLGTACGDSASGALCPETDYAFFTSRAGRGSAWFRIHMEECSDCCAYLQHRYRLTMPEGVDYDLYAYSACGGRLEASSTNGAGQADEVTPFFNDVCLGGGYDGLDILIEIRHVSGESCGNWTLQVENRE